MAWIAPIASAIIGYLGASKAANANKPTALDDAIKNYIYNNMRQTGPMGLGLLGQAVGNFGSASDYAGGILRGGYQNALSMLGPEADANARATQGAYASAARSDPRTSGTGSERLGLMDSALANWRGGLVGLRPTAAQFLTSIGSGAGSLGTSLLGMGGSSGLGLLGYGLQNRMAGFDMSRAAMQAIAQGLGGFDWSSLGGGKTTTTPQQTPYQPIAPQLADPKWSSLGG